MISEALPLQGRDHHVVKHKMQRKFLTFGEKFTRPPAEGSDGFLLTAPSGSLQSFGT
jgi:hypothetical protein